MSSKMKIVLVYEDIFSLSCPRGVRQEFRDLRVLKIDSLSPDTLISPSTFMTCPSSQGAIAHNVKFMYIIYGILFLCKNLIISFKDCKIFTCILIHRFEIEKCINFPRSLAYYTS